MKQNDVFGDVICVCMWGGGMHGARYVHTSAHSWEG